MYSTPEAMDKAVSVVEEMYSFDKSSNKNAPKISVATDGDWWDISISTRALLENGSLAIDGICEDFNARNTEQAWYDDFVNDAPYGVATDVWEYMTATYGAVCVHSDNSYNHESHMDDIVQYSYCAMFNGAEDYLDWYDIAEDGFGYVLLQIHRGGDVRGNYTVSRLFRVTDPYAFLDEEFDGVARLKHPDTDDEAEVNVCLTSGSFVYADEWEPIGVGELDPDCYDNIFDEDYCFNRRP